MDLKELSDLITIRNYVLVSVDDFAIDKETSRYMGDLKLMLDQKIIELLKDEKFKDYVGYDGLTEVKQERAKTQNESFQKARQTLNAERGLK